jgi:hypothetical protein
MPTQLWVRDTGDVCTSEGHVVIRRDGYDSSDAELIMELVAVYNASQKQA